MTRNVESRIQEGLNQLQAFRSLPQEEKDSLISKKFNTTARNVKFVDAIMSSSCFGTQRIWRQLPGIGPMNPSILRLVLNKNNTFELQNLPQEFWEAITSVRDDVSPTWNRQDFQIEGHTIAYPILSYDETKLARIRMNMI